MDEEGAAAAGEFKRALSTGTGALTPQRDAW
jgi:hypothetical protein